jgi:hypothetical protein
MTSGWSMKLMKACDKYDLAVADVPEADGFQVPQISPMDPEGIPDLLTWDYSTGFRGGWLPRRTQVPRLIPYMWHGKRLAMRQLRHRSREAAPFSAPFSAVSSTEGGKR